VRPGRAKDLAFRLELGGDRREMGFCIVAERLDLDELGALIGDDRRMV
jgi:hypothetical protein